MFSQTIRYIACSLIGVATLFLALGALLFQAAFVTGAASDYHVPVSWLSALSSAIWPPSWRLFLLLLGVLFLATLTLLIFFRAPRSVGVGVLFLQAGTALYWGGALGWFFIFREFEAYHFSMDAEKLGEYWFAFEAVAIWSLAAAALAVIRVFVRKQLAESSSR
jgi:hypothetical protein